MTVQLAQKILVDKFRSEPFHNLYLLKNALPVTTAYGGTCSDKTLSYLESAKASGLEAYLHTARIDGEEKHRLIRLEIGGQRYFADIGNGWPSIRLFSAKLSTAYECFGMRYRSEVENGLIKIYHSKRGVEKLQMEIDIAQQDEAKIYEGIANRFSSNITYPFGDELRFSMIIGQKFLFLRGTRLEIYSHKEYQEVTNVELDNLKYEIATHFDYDISPIERHIEQY
ncbi:hypothetical protein MSG37_10505 [Shewanella sp. 1CM18E]|uniref:hypothetical protein n=1 Tax=Shewanella sp. 1CM18E TaxID=2929169 RepID=UPI0020C0BC48|nr:hypothetical protein [Shewanella sp. 1CM18E]MCK8045321.1 hypothetical protein [Shewanella sp. 1CM18E]